MNKLNQFKKIIIQIITLITEALQIKLIKIQIKKLTKIIIIIKIEKGITDHIKLSHILHIKKII